MPNVQCRGLIVAMFFGELLGQYSAFHISQLSINKQPYDVTEEQNSNMN